MKSSSHGKSFPVDWLLVAAQSILENIYGGTELLLGVSIDLGQSWYFLLQVWTCQNDLGVGWLHSVPLIYAPFIDAVRSMCRRQTKRNFDTHSSRLSTNYQPSENLTSDCATITQCAHMYIYIFVLNASLACNHVRMIVELILELCRITCSLPLSV